MYETECFTCISGNLFLKSSLESNNHIERGNNNGDRGKNNGDIGKNNGERGKNNGERGKNDGDSRPLHHC
jgi:hypothetical protein